MKVEEIEVGATYANGDVKRAVISYGATPEYVVWQDEKYRLPYGGFTDTRCTRTKTFAKWAERKV